MGNRPVGAQNIIATLPGRANPPAIIIISAHYDSRTLDITDARSAAPGANDDGSGTVAVLELARALSQQDMDATFMFILFAGEEEGLYGSTHLAPLMRKQGAHIVAMLNNDIIGNTMGADGTRIADRVRVYSGEPDDGPSRHLAREVKRIAESAMPDFGIELIPKIDRRAGDHMPFHYAGFPAVRFTEPNENLEHQHNADDRVEFMDIPYLAQVVRVNLAVALELARVNRGQ
ncbi:MAG TPA: M20/M25/M40 family metallo-hydrolase [Chloroflexota bacterium]|nr:M20/M25/M40 family metallo-hydrolase [Chloroflexota bacterium]